MSRRASKWPCSRKNAHNVDSVVLRNVKSRSVRGLLGANASSRTRLWILTLALSLIGSLSILARARGTSSFGDGLLAVPEKASHSDADAQPTVRGSKNVTCPGFGCTIVVDDTSVLSYSHHDHVIMELPEPRK